MTPKKKTLHPALVNAGIEGNNDEAHLEHDARAVANYGKLDEQHHVPSTKMHLNGVAYEQKNADTPEPTATEHYLCMQIRQQHCPCS